METMTDDKDTKCVIEEVLYYENLHKELKQLFVEKFRKYEN